MQIKENVLLAPYTVFKIGGSARYFCEVKNKEEIVGAIKWADEKSLPIFVLGTGSNVLISDEGFPGLVIRNKIVGLNIEPTDKFTRITAGGGGDWDEFVELAVDRQLAGVECLSGIPGTVGAAPVQNIGAYGQSVAGIIESVFAINLKTSEEMVFKNNACGFDYRTSKFKQNPGSYIVTAVSFLLKPSGLPTLAYHDLKNYFNGVVSPTLKEVREAVLEIRSRKGMVIRGEELHSSVGSFFMNPIMSEVLLENLKSKVYCCQKDKNCCSPPWFWVRKDGLIKVSAACLIECAGFKRGFKKGGVGISSLHSLALVNHGKSSAKEVLSLANEIMMGVKEKFRVDLDIEPQLVGF